jgi:hypothetical protein
MASERYAGLVIDEGALALRATLDVPAVPADHDRSCAAAVEDQDRALAFGQRLERVPQCDRKEPSISGGKLGSQIHDFDARRGAARPVR